jgi:acyl-CoA synthetase (AMP-forming)/AMP-acid ligase II
MATVMKLHDTLDYWAKVQPDAEFAVHDGRHLDYAHAARLASDMGRALARDLNTGDRFAILARNCVEMGLLYYAASKAGVVPVPLNYRLAPPEWQYILDDAQVKLIIADAEYVAKLRAVDSVATMKNLICVDSADIPGWVSLGRWIADAGEIVAETRDHSEQLQIYTSGTTGYPKGAVLGVGSVHSLIDQWRICFPMSARERLLLVAPMYHVGGTFHFFHAVAHGASLYMMTDFDAARVVRALAHERIGMAFMVPAMLQMCLEIDGVANQDYPDFRLLSYGASPISQPTLRRALDIFSCEFVQGFGMTECPNITYLTARDHVLAAADWPDLLDSCGRVGPGSQLKIIREDGESAAPGEVGEICGKGPQIMLRYWNQPTATSEAIRDGWMHTGDAGYVDQDGYLFVKDRIKDMIVSGAENIYPREIENILLMHPDIIDAAVIGVPSEQWGETVKAIVVRRPGSAVTEQQIIDHCRSQLAGYKRPHGVDFVDALPRNGAGKVLKKTLRAPYWEGHQRFVS